MARFAILRSGGDGDRAHAAWLADLRARGVCVAREALAGEGRVLRPVEAAGAGVRILEERWWDAEEAAREVLVVEAEDLARAVEIARGCPALRHGATVTVRPVVDLDSDGQDPRAGGSASAAGD